MPAVSGDGKKKRGVMRRARGKSRAVSEHTGRVLAFCHTLEDAHGRDPARMVGQRQQRTGEDDAGGAQQVIADVERLLRTFVERAPRLQTEVVQEVRTLRRRARHAPQRKRCVPDASV